ncbi:MAG TPA: hypothetical protein VIF11_07000 [Methylomirabilota bacterium]
MQTVSAGFATASGGGFGTVDERALPAYTDPTIVPGQTVSTAVHLQQLRTVVSALP